MWSTPEARFAATKNRTFSGESLIVVAVKSMAGTLRHGPWHLRDAEWVQHHTADDSGLEVSSC